jgi:negative regulator of flagellin synthesis FlgM
MKIDGGKPPESPDVVKLQKAGKNGKIDQSNASGQTKAGDKVDVSGKAREIAELMGAVKALPEVRTEKVAEIKGLIDSGQYVADPAKIAGRMIDEVI